MKNWTIHQQCFTFYRLISYVGVAQIIPKWIKRNVNFPTTGRNRKPSRRSISNEILLSPSRSRENRTSYYIARTGSHDNQKFPKTAKNFLTSMTSAAVASRAVSKFAPDRIAEIHDNHQR